MKNFIIPKNKHISGIIKGAGKYRATQFSSESQTSPHSVVSCFHFNLQILHGINQAKNPNRFLFEQYHVFYFVPYNRDKDIPQISDSYSSSLGSVVGTP